MYERELPTGLVLNSFSFLSRFGYVVVFGSLFCVQKLNQDFKIALVFSAVKKFKPMASKLWFGSVTWLKAAAFRFFVK